jgi:hypothetical protein
MEPESWERYREKELTPTTPVTALPKQALPPGPVPHGSLTE